MWGLVGDPEDRFSHDEAHMVKTFKIFSYRTNSPMIMKLGMEHYELKLYTVCINDFPEFTLTYLTTMSILAKLIFVLIVGPAIR